MKALFLHKLYQQTCRSFTERQVFIFHKVIGLNAAQAAGGQVAREAADDVIMGDRSRRVIRLRELMEQGYTEEEANKILIEQDIRAVASIAPIVAGGVQYGAARAMRAASDIDDIVRRHEYGDKADPSFTDTDMALAEILQEDAPRKPFTDEADGGIVEEKDTFDSNKINTGGMNQDFAFTIKTIQHMNDPNRSVPLHILHATISNNTPFPDPRGSSAKMYYDVIYRNGQKYNLEVLYDEKTNTIYHFKYSKEAMGNLPEIK